MKRSTCGRPGRVDLIRSGDQRQVWATTRENILHMCKENLMKTQHLVGLCLAMVISSAIMAAPTTAASNVDENSPIKDSWLTAKTKMALFADPRVKGRQIQVETTQGQVSFRGMVDSEEASQTSEDIAKGISGVKV